MNSKVYVVFGYDGESAYIEDIFAKEEDAKAYAQHCYELDYDGIYDSIYVEPYNVKESFNVEDFGKSEEDEEDE